MKTILITGGARSGKSRLAQELALKSGKKVLFVATATAEDIDQACKVGLSHAMGPLATADLIGLDTLLHIIESMFEEYGEPRFKAPPMLRRMVSLGNWGRKSDKGFFEYAT